MLKLFLDTEFTSLEVPQLISVGLVAETGPECYVELLGIRQEDCSNFVFDEVWPHLKPRTFGLQRPAAAARIKSWIALLGEPVQLATDSLEYDWRLIEELLRSNDCWPSNLAPAPAIIEVDPLAIEVCFALQPAAIRHHALWDARALETLVQQGSGNE